MPVTKGAQFDQFHWARPHRSQVWRMVGAIIIIWMRDYIDRKETKKRKGVEERDWGIERRRDRAGLSGNKETD